ncbi:DUF6479 family protein [Streptomyces sp. NPDC059788]|uniref:DUF6479 family protein n=1 Tax=Streptomyces sp. NPDC059788 TaxID=3346948 RepID=UPI00364B6BEF
MTATTASATPAQDLTSVQQAVDLTRDMIVGTGPLVAGLVIVAALILAVVYGRRRRAREPAPPEPETQPTPPKNPTGYESELRDPNEVPRDGDHRLTPHELPDYGNAPTRHGADQDRERKRWQDGHSGSFGGG